MNRTNRDPNEIIEHEDYAEIVLYNKKQEEVSRALIDLEDIDKVKDLKWYMDSRRYAFNGKKRILLHRLVMDCPKGIEVDHIYHNPLDNRKSQLRYATSSQQKMNTKIRCDNSSGHRGVYYDKSRNTWNVNINIQNESFRKR